jgi:hypothetical protein
MADDAVFPGPEKKGGIPTWLIIGGVGVGALALVMVVSKNTGSGGTTAAGASINAGLGSLQEEQMNLLGSLQSGQLQNNANFAAVGGQITDTQNAILGAISAQGTTTGSQIQNAIDTVNQNTNSQTQSVLGSIATGLQQLLTGQGNISATIQSEQSNLSSEMSSGFAGVNSNVTASQQQVVSALSTAQNAETSVMSQIESQIGQLLGLQQQLNTQTGQDYANTTAQINALQSNIGQEIASGNANLTAAMNSVAAATVAGFLPQNLGTGYFVGNDHRIHIGNYMGTGQPGWGSSQGLMADISWAIGSTSSNPNVFLGHNPVAA